MTNLTTLLTSSSSFGRVLKLATGARERTQRERHGYYITVSIPDPALDFTGARYMYSISVH